MSILQRGARVGAATVVVGFSLAWPSATGIASADNPDQDSSSSVSAGPAKSGAPSTGRTARTVRSNSAKAADTAASAAATGAATPTVRLPRPAAAVASRSVAPRPVPTIGAARRASTAPVTATLITDAVLNAFGSADPASTAATTTTTAVVTVTTATPPISAPTAAVPAAADNLGGLRVPVANDLLSTITDFFTGIANGIQSLFEGVGLLIRRFFFNQAPTVNPIQTTGQTSDPLGGTITGSINAVDPEDDPITYKVTQEPLHGSVTVDGNGTYTYIPNNTFTGADAFTISATDTGFHINLFDLGRAASTDAMVSVTQSTGDPRIGFTFIFGSGARYWSSTARAALQTTAIYLSSYFIVTQPVTITYSVTGRNSTFSDTLASAGSDLVSTDPGFYDTVVQDKILHPGTDPNGSAPDGTIDWNFGQPWAFGDSVASNQYDFQSTAMHELLHTFGFLSVIDSAGNNTGTNWTTFDGFVVTSNGTDPFNGYVWNTAYNANLTGGGGGLYFGGPKAKAANNGNPVPLFTPSPWDGGSSMSHLDDATYTGVNAKLMNARTDTGLGIRVLSPIEIGILRDLGYEMADQPQTLVVFVIGFAFLRRRRRTGERV